MDTRILHSCYNCKAIVFNIHQAIQVEGRINRHVFTKGEYHYYFDFINFEAEIDMNKAICSICNENVIPIDLSDKEFKHIVSAWYRTRRKNLVFNPNYNSNIPSTQQLYGKQFTAFTSNMIPLKFCIDRFSKETLERYKVIFASALLMDLK